MEQEAMNLLINGGANVAFAGFLFWQYKEQQKRADEREEKAEKKEEELRRRYDAVIADYRDKEEKVRQSLEKDTCGS